MRSGTLAGLTELWDYRDLLRELVSREMKVRYRRSALGFLWSLITPLYQVVIFTFVFKFIMHVEDSNLWVKMLVGIIPWTFFSVGVLNSCSAVMRYRNVVKKVYFPRQMLVFATVSSNLIHLLLTALVMFVIFLFIPVKFFPSFLFLIPLVILQTIFISGLGLIVCVAHTYYGDVEYILTNVMQVAMFLTPVVYDMSRITTWPPLYQTLYRLNPMAVYTEGWRGILLRNQLPDPGWLAYAAAFSCLTFLLGLWVWRRYQWRFPEVI